MTEQKKLAEIAQRIRSAVVRIGEKSNTSIRSIIDPFLRLVSPTLAVNGASEFPRALHRHPRDPMLSSWHSRGDLIVFHVGNTVMAYYDVVLGLPIKPLHECLARLEAIAKDPQNFVPAGSDMTGWTLVEKATVKRAPAELTPTTTPVKAAATIPPPSGAGKTTVGK